MEQLLIDDNNAITLGSIEAAPISNNEIEGQDKKGKRSKSESAATQERSLTANKESMVGAARIRSKSSAKSFRKGAQVLSSSFICSHIMKWSFKNNPNCELFRRCMLPFYLLKDDSGT